MGEEETMSGLTEPLSSEELAEWEELTEQSTRRSGRLGRMRPEKVKKLSPATLASVREDDHYEEHHGINGLRACRICGICLARLRPRHIAYLSEKHEPMDSRQYRDYCRLRGWGMPPVDSVLKLKQARNGNEAAKERDPDGAKLQANRSSRNQRDRIRTDEKYRQRSNELSRGRLFSRRSSNGRELVPCLESPCSDLGHKFEWLDPHLVSVHEMSWREYQRKHPDALRGTPEQLETRTAHLVDMRTKYRDQFSGGRPADWMERPTDWRIIGNELLSKEHMSNKELAARLDASRIAKCPYSDTWDASVKERGFEKFINQIRGWVKRPGRVAESKAVNSLVRK